TFTTTATAGTGTTLSVKNSTSNTSASSAIGKSNSTGNAGPPPAFNTSYTDLSGTFSQVSAGVFANATINVTGGRLGDLNTDGIINAADIDLLSAQLRSGLTGAQIFAAHPDYALSASDIAGMVVTTSSYNHEIGSLVDTTLGGGPPHGGGTHPGDADLSGVVN